MKSNRNNESEKIATKEVKQNDINEKKRNNKKGYQTNGYNMLRNHAHRE